MRADIDCNCGKMNVHEDCGFKGYIYTCANCGKTYRGGWWILTWLWCLQPVWFLCWRSKRKMYKIIEKRVKQIMAEATA